MSNEQALKILDKWAEDVRAKRWFTGTDARTIALAMKQTAEQILIALAPQADGK